MREPQEQGQPSSGKRGRRTQPPDPATGPAGAFAHELWQLKLRAGDPSFATMGEKLGAAASKSSLAAATRGVSLPSWETTWEFVRALAVTSLGEDEAATRELWSEKWEAARAAKDAPPVPVVAVAARRRWPIWVFSLAAAGVVAAVLLAFLWPQNDEDSGIDNATLVGETLRDGTVVHVGDQVGKTFRIQNIGTRHWRGRWLTRMNTLSTCTAPAMVPIRDTAPGEIATIDIPVTATAVGQCKLDWKMTDGDRKLLMTAKNPVYLDLQVR